MMPVIDLTIDEEMPRARLALLLKQFSELGDDREPWRVMYPLEEVLLLVTCATVASCDDFDDIVAWGEHHLDFLRRFSEFHHGVPCERWVRNLVNRIDPILFGRCFENWVAALWPDRHEFIAIDGKTARRTHDRRKGLKALHTLSAYATTARLTLAQLSVPEKTNEITAIPDVLDQLAAAGQLEGALVSIDAMGCQVEIADKIVAHKADYMLALKGNQPTLENDVVDYFHTAPPAELVTKTTVEKGHGRIETRTYTASNVVDWIVSERSYPGQPRFTSVKTIVKVDTRTEHADRSTFDTRLYISSAPRDIERIAKAIRRLVSADEKGVTFKYKDYRIEGPGRYKAMTLATDEFIRRFLIHVLPKGVHRIRHYGLLANSNRAANIAHARKLLAMPLKEPETANAAEPAEPSVLPRPCPCCRGRMIIIETFARGCEPKHRPTPAPAAIRIDTS